MEQTFVKPLVIFFFISFQKIIINKILVYTGTMDYQYLKPLVAPKQKNIQKLFKNNHLNITIQCNLKIVNYLDVTFNLSNATYRPFCKPNNEIAYIHKESNHPPSILRQIPLSIESRLSKHSSNEKIFIESTQIY